ncbi:site-2 protease family protein [Bacillus kwashiorkori]|uniref:site-2 protease family protein n=1 Tax=Bacillus kwashiorkori TaxID=1522318 RepID=UPI00078472B2|nr:site-2 protease family protein [Bacillus kwashiorkori]
MNFLNQILAFPLQTLPFIIISLVIAFSVHEFAHAFVAYKFGDNTAARQGRLTLNPAVHLDPIGTLILLLFGFGWARPVPVNRYNFAKPRLAGVLVSVAGPLSNLLLAAIGALLLHLLMLISLPSAIGFFLYELCIWFSYLNIVLFVFNLLPIPPLDGYRIIEDLVPNNVRAKMSQYEVYGMILFLVLVIVDPLYNITIGPIFHQVIPFFLKLLGIDFFI